MAETSAFTFNQRAFNGQRRQIHEVLFAACEEERRRAVLAAGARGLIG